MGVEGCTHLRKGRPHALVLIWREVGEGLPGPQVELRRPWPELRHVQAARAVLFAPVGGAVGLVATPAPDANITPFLVRLHFHTLAIHEQRELEGSKGL